MDIKEKGVTSFSETLSQIAKRYFLKVTYYLEVELPGASSCYLYADIQI